MSIRVIVSRLTDAKNQMMQSKAAATSTASGLAEASNLVRKVLDGVQDKGLPDALTAHGETITNVFNGAAAVGANGVDNAIRNFQAIGSGR